MIGFWGFKGEKDNFQEDEKSKCLVNKCLPCREDRSSDEKLPIVLALSWYRPSINFFRQLRGKSTALPSSVRS